MSDIIEEFFEGYSDIYIIKENSPLGTVKGGWLPSSDEAQTGPPGLCGTGLRSFPKPGALGGGVLAADGFLNNEGT